MLQTHSNPCFLRKDGGMVPMIKDQKRLMENDETFGLLRDRLFFKVMYDVPNGTTKRLYLFGFVLNCHFNQHFTNAFIMNAVRCKIYVFTIHFRCNIT